ncbi:MAG: hypothetical protein HC853_16490 [Anaerolineae bacterium]|nr:hypothetical protein [Anaerolineae bacterium]
MEDAGSLAALILVVASFSSSRAASTRASRFFVRASLDSCAATAARYCLYASSWVMRSWAFSLTSLLMIIMMVVWMSISKDGTVNGFSRADFVTYYMVGMVVRQLTAVWASWEMDFSIREGILSPKLLRPLHPIHNDIAANWGEKAIRMVIVLPLVITVLWLTPGVQLDLSPLTLLLFILSIGGAWVIMFFMDYLTGLLAFWTTQVTAFITLVEALRILFAGILAPIQMFPLWLQNIIQFLPFRYVLSFSIEIVTGRVQGAQLLFGFAMQLFWAVFMVLAVRAVWARAMRSYSAVGA